MRALFVSLAVLLLIPILAACENFAGTALTAPPPEVTAVPASPLVPSETDIVTEAPSPAADPAIKAVITDFILAENAHDWSAFLSLWTKEEQKYFKDFFAYSNNEKNKNGYFAIKSAQLADLREIENAKTKLYDYSSADFPYEIGSGFRYDLQEKYGDVRVFIAKADYTVDKEFWDYREGLNYRVLVLVPDGGKWRVAQDYLGNPGAAEFFDEPVPEEQDDNTGDVTEEKNDLVDGTVHFTKELDCYYLGLNWGDYGHIGVRTIEGDEIWFWMMHTKVDPETLTRYQKIRITWENRDKYIDEAGEVINQDAVVDIKVLD
jgi:hypothetical protein